MEEDIQSKNLQSTALEAEIIGIKFGLATHKEICAASISGCSISHSSQLTNPFLGLPLEFGKCESCGASETGQCEGHFGYIELPIPIYHPSHVSELKKMLSLLCLKCLKMKKNKFQTKNPGMADRVFACCEEASQVSIREAKNADGAFFLQLKLPSKSRHRDGAWNFLERYGFRYNDSHSRPLLPCEVMEMLKKIPKETKRKLTGKGYFPQDGYIIRYLPVPPNCLSVPDISDGISTMSSDLSISMLKKVLRQVEVIKSSRSGAPNFESHEVEANDLQIAVDQYLQLRGAAKASRDIHGRLSINKETNDSTKAWLEKMKTLFIRKGSGFSSRSVITGDPYKPVNVIGIPYEIAQKITFEERVNMHNARYLQELVDNKLCLTYRDGSSTYSLREGSKGHTFLRTGQVVHRRIMDGDIVFINRPPTTHKHSLQALSVYVHDDHTVKINPLICGPLSADFDGDCIHLFYPQSPAAKAEVMELFSVEKQLLSSHSGNLNLQLTSDSLLSLKTLFKVQFLDKAAVQQLAMFVSASLPQPAVSKVHSSGPRWTAPQILQIAFPDGFNCSGDRYLISESNILKFDFSRDVVQLVINEIVTSICFGKGPEAVLTFFNSIQPLLMENLFSEGFSVGLEDFAMSKAIIENIEENFRVISPLLQNLRSTYNELVELQLESHIRGAKLPVADFILGSSALGNLIDSRSDSALTKVIQQVGYLGLQMSDRGKFYSKTLVEDVASHFARKYPSDVVDYPSAQHGLITGCFFLGLDPYEEIVHSISTREVIVRSSRGLSEPGTLFKNLMAILRDVVICYDGTVRNICSNSIIQFEYGVNAGTMTQSLFSAGEPVGVLAATAMSNPAYKAVLDSTPSSNSSWELMKEILLCKVSFKNDRIDRRVILYLNDCDCGRKYCQEKAAYLVKNHLEKISLKDVTDCFMIEYKQQYSVSQITELEIDTGLVGHVHLRKMKLQELRINMQAVLQKCHETINSFRKKKKVANIFKRLSLSVSDCCSFEQSRGKVSSGMPCLTFFWQDSTYAHLERTSDILADIIYPVLLETIIKGDHRVSSANIIWVSPDTTSWISNPSKNQKRELALDIVLEKSAVKQSGDAWRIVLDCCLPIFHLIDTTRSIPYAVKQVQELLGISSAFDQAVQRLSTSVTMVAKGVLKEHLILLGNSMTCAGNLVGFNSGGYKAISRSLDVQVPFTEATLFTPRKCFERAAEKCHVDTLASVVASCSWGKPVAVGTGSRFDVLWDKNLACLNQEKNVDVYNFLHMVSSGNGEELTSACLGEEVDFMGDEVDDWSLSPERHDKGSDKPVFEDSAQYEEHFDNLASEMNWEMTDRKKETANEKSWSSWKADAAAEPEKLLSPKAHENYGTSAWDTGSAWQTDANKNSNAEKSNSWSSWKEEKSEAHAATKDQSESDRSSNWDSFAGRGRKNGENTEDENCGINTSESNSWSGRGASAGWGGGDDAFGSIQEKSKIPEDSTGWASKGKKPKSPEVSAGWSSKDNSAWEKPKTSDVSIGWGSKEKSPLEKSKSQEASQGWGKPKESAGWGSKENSTWEKPKTPEVSSRWGSKEETPKSPGGWVSHENSPWEKPKTSEVSAGWGSKEKTSEVSAGWGSKEKTSEVLAGWGSKEKTSEVLAGWGSKEKTSEVSIRWGSKEKTSEVSARWGSKENSAFERPNSPEVSQGWGIPKESVKTGSWNAELPVEKSPWEKPKSPEVSKGWGSTKDRVTTGSSHVDNSPWERPKTHEVSVGWGSKEKGPSERLKSTEASQGWGSPKESTVEKSPWEKPKSPELSSGWGSAKDLVKAGSSHAESAVEGNLWEKPKSVEVSHACGSANDSVKAGGSSMEEDSPWGKQKSPKVSDAWGSSKDPVHVGGSATDDSPWGKPKSPKVSDAWGLTKDPVKAGGSVMEDSPWGKPKSPEVSHGWGSPKKSTKDGNLQSWGQPNAGGGEEKSQQWGQRSGGDFKKKRFEGSRAWPSSNTGEWKGKRNHPPKGPGASNDDSRYSEMFTATRQRLDLFTSDEQNILNEVEPLMRSIRRIMHQSGYNDGDPLSADDQTYIIDNVFNYHPDKAAKMGSGLDHITVSESSFQGSRCFYVVSTDGSKQDFSYRKCLENFIKGKYPELVEDFIGKYFARNRSGGGNRQRNPALTPVQSPALAPEQIPAPDPEQSPAPVPEQNPVLDLEGAGEEK